MNIASEIRRARARRGMSQGELAGKAGCSKSYISSLEQGRKKNPSTVVLKKIFKALGLRMATR